MKMDVPLSHLVTGNLNWTICICISRVWEYHGSDGEDPLKHLDLVVVDLKGTAMYVEIPPQVVPLFKDKLEEGRVVTMRKFTVQKAKPAYKVVEATLMIKLTRFTEINRVEREPHGFPKYVFTLIPFSELEDHTNKKDQFLDVLGQITAVSNAALVNVRGGKQQTKRVVMLKDLSGNTLQVSLWGQRATEFDGDTVHKIGQYKFVIVIFVGTLMKNYQKQKSFLSGTSACRWYINENIPQIQEYYSKLPSQMEPVEKLHLDSEQIVQSEVQDKTILQLKDIDPFEQLGHKFRCSVTITRLALNQTWWYLACKSCHWTSRLIGSMYQCTKDGCPCTQAEPRYKLCLMGSDDTHELEFVLFGPIAQLIAKPVQWLREKYDTPPEISRLVGQRCSFLVKIAPKRTIAHPEDDPSFEVIFIEHQFGKQSIIPKPRRNESQSSSSSSMVTSSSQIPSLAIRNLPPLIPIKSKQNNKQMTMMAPTESEGQSDPMEVEPFELKVYQEAQGGTQNYDDLSSNTLKKRKL